MATEIHTIILAATAETATFSTTPYSLPNAGGPRRGYVYRILISASSGTTPTMVVTALISVDGGTTYLTVATAMANKLKASWQTITGIGEYYIYVHVPVMEDLTTVYPFLLKFTGTIAGTTPSFTTEIAQVLGMPG